MPLIKVLYGYVTLCCVYDQGVESIGWSVRACDQWGMNLAQQPATLQQQQQVDRDKIYQWIVELASPDTRENALLELRSVPCQPQHTRKCSARTQVSPLPALTRVKMLC